MLCLTYQNTNNRTTKGYYKVVHYDSKNIEIECSESINKLKKNIKIELVSYSKEGIFSEREDFINYKNGLKILSVNNNRITFDTFNKIEKKILTISKYFLVLKNRQSHLMFRITHH
tara:strand:- start:135 stop:482 length:348 start_codon:yes stop_codon:yes gene_type:complete